MLYSGADLIRNAGQQQERLERLRVVSSVESVEGGASPSTVIKSAGSTDSQLDQDTQGALERLARFIHKKKKAPARPSPQEKGPPTNPYKRAQDCWRRQMDAGQLLDLYI